jgi:hypothetical protein
MLPKEISPAVSKPEARAKREEIPPAEGRAPKEGEERVLSRPAPADVPRIPAALPPPPKPAEADKPVRETSREPVRTMPPEKLAILPGERAKVEAPKPAPAEPPRASFPLVPAPGPKSEESAKIGKDIATRETTPLPLAKEEEVKQFFARYMDQYNGKDVEGLLSLFSPEVVQNQKYGYHAIQRIYAKFFEDSQKLKYQVKPEKIEISTREAKVRGTYLIEQETKSGEIKMWRGSIEWTLVREQGALKVRTLQYEHTLKP